MPGDLDPAAVGDMICVINAFGRRRRLLLRCSYRDANKLVFLLSLAVVVSSADSFLYCASRSVDSPGGSAHLHVGCHTHAGCHKCTRQHRPSFADNRRRRCSQIYAHVAPSSVPDIGTAATDQPAARGLGLGLGGIIIHWRGEGNVEGYSMPFRQLELESAISAESSSPILEPTMEHLTYSDALKYDYADRDTFPEKQRILYETALQYMTGSSLGVVSTRALCEAARRCSLVRAVYGIVAESETYGTLALKAVENGSLTDMMTGGVNANSTWCVRLRQFGAEWGDAASSVRYGRAKKSPLRLERGAISKMEQLLVQFGGRVQLQDPECKLFIFEGLVGKQKILARTLAVGPKTSAIAPVTRICATNTPLCPIAAFSMCNIAQIRNGHTVLDPFAGSCATLLAAATLAPGCKTVGIELASDDVVNRDDILRDFSTRDLAPPVALIEGDSNCSEVRERARAAVGGHAFDVIIADPPYGIRERRNAGEAAPLVALVSTIAEDEQAGTPLLTKGGRLVAFVPNMEGEDLSASMPDDALLSKARLKMASLTEQPLNDVLSRWLVCYICQ